jgi:hypothetical protein
MLRTLRPRRGRPPHRDDPPKLFSTTIPTSVYALLSDIATRQGRPKSEVLTDAIRGYGRRVSFLKPMSK